MSQILLHSIKEDMKRKSIASYQLFEEVADNITSLKVGANEAIYIHTFHAIGREHFQLEMKSAIKSHTYNHYNCEFTPPVYDGGFPHAKFSSYLLHSHYSPIEIINPSNMIFFIQYVRVIFNPNN